jgi:thioester reductase-like protein
MILITGATGFVGGRMLEKFIQTFDNQQVVGTGRNSEVIAKWQSKGIAIESGDLSDADFTTSLFEKYAFKTVIHVAAKSSPWGTYDSFYQSNVVATRNLLEAASAKNVERLIYISTPSIYFNFKNRFNVKENDDELQTIIIVSHDIEPTLSIADTVWLVGKQPDGSAAIVETINMMERGLTWQKNIEEKPEFQQMVTYVTKRFWQLNG